MLLKIIWTQVMGQKFPSDSRAFHVLECPVEEDHDQAEESEDRKGRGQIEQSVTSEGLF
jgi:hypothetical protein